MKREDDQQLWDLLGRTSEPKLSPFFARDVVRAVRQRSQSFDLLRSWFSSRRLVPVAGLAVAIIAAIMTFHHPAIQKSADKTPDAISKIDAQDYDVVADLEELLVTDESSLWDDDTQTL